MKFQNIKVIVRSSNERTENNCKQLLEQLFEKESIDIVHEIPFSAAIKRSFEIAIKSRKDWLLCIDADVLISKIGLEKVLSKLDKYSKKTFCVQGLILDKFFGIFRPAGNHFYNIHHLKKAINYIPKDGETLRPESFIKREMALLDFPTQQSDIIIGIHDYEQYYADIYRKCFLQAHKHRSFVDYVLPKWRSLASIDFDFKVAIYGVTSGKIFSDKVNVSKEFIKDEILDVMEIKGITEKTHSFQFNFMEIDKLIDENIQYQNEIQEIMFPHERWNEILNRNTILNKKRYNIWHLFIIKTGNGLIKLGKWIHNLS
ncbi:hypothetical protein QWY93_00800 [Echinicola jeungdonensis]|uniref:Glycosyl transferase family 2 n=1 Tax=Echinicola jeungdonensis TaxID=709343 RepID=A0ABV5J4B8_9BACT|nr:hypothetical protein [Echinicola jeungdonensis]MDN3667878.1 hypothetical protein [Echinicola jeungdonensis]